MRENQTKKVRLANAEPRKGVCHALGRLEDETSWSHDVELQKVILFYIYLLQFFKPQISLWRKMLRPQNHALLFAQQA